MGQLHVPTLNGKGYTMPCIRFYKKDSYIKIKLKRTQYEHLHTFIYKN